MVFNFWQEHKLGQEVVPEMPYLAEHLRPGTIYHYCCIQQSLKRHTSFGYMLEALVGGEELVSSSLSYSKQEVGADSGAAPY